MTPLFPARRRAERFDSLVEGGRRDDVDRSTSDLLELVSTLRSVPEAQARPEFVADLRERLMVAAVSELTPVTPDRDRDAVARLTIKPARTRRERRFGIALGAVAIIGATTSMAVASQSAIPGDALYPVKRAIENTQAGFSVGDDAKGETILGNASTRLDEVDKLTQKKKPDAKLVTHTLNDFTDQFTDGSQAAARRLRGERRPGLDQPGPPERRDQRRRAERPRGRHSAGRPRRADGRRTGGLRRRLGGAEPLPGSRLRRGHPRGAVAAAGRSRGGPSGTLNTVTGGALPGTQEPSSAPTTAPQDQGKGQGQPSGLNPPETPIQLPTEPSDTTTDLGGILPGGGTDTGSGSGTGGGTQGTQGGGKDPKGPKGGKHHPVDLTPVTDTVNEVVTGVVEGVNGLLAGLAGTSN